MSQAGKTWNAVRQIAKSTNQDPTQIGEILSVKPISIQYQGVELNKANGDKIYINNLLQDEVISFETANPITCSDGSITENHTNIINAITNWLGSIHNRYILHTGDLVAVQKLGNNTYIVLEKVANE